MRLLASSAALLLATMATAFAVELPLPSIDFPADWDLTAEKTCSVRETNLLYRVYDRGNETVARIDINGKTVAQMVRGEKVVFHIILGDEVKTFIRDEDSQDDFLAAMYKVTGLTGEEFKDCITSK